MEIQFHESKLGVIVIRSFILFVMQRVNTCNVEIGYFLRHEHGVRTVIPTVCPQGPKHNPCFGN